MKILIALTLLTTLISCTLSESPPVPVVPEKQMTPDFMIKEDKMMLNESIVKPIDIMEETDAMIIPEAEMKKTT